MENDLKRAALAAARLFPLDEVEVEEMERCLWISAGGRSDAECQGRREAYDDGKWLNLALGKNFTSADCACCVRYYTVHSDPECCEGCPIWATTGERFCGGTPYYEEGWVPDDQELALEEYQFLIDLALIYGEELYRRRLAEEAREKERSGEQWDKYLRLFNTMLHWEILAMHTVEAELDQDDLPWDQDMYNDLSTEVQLYLREDWMDKIERLGYVEYVFTYNSSYTTEEKGEAGPWRDTGFVTLPQIDTGFKPEEHTDDVMAVVDWVLSEAYREALAEDHDRARLFTPTNTRALLALFEQDREALLEQVEAALRRREEYIEELLGIQEEQIRMLRGES